MPALRVFAARALCGLIFCLPAVPQQTTPPPAATPSGQPTVQFKGSATEVIVPVTVTDDKGRFVSNLVKKDFRVLDEGKPQHIEFFSHDEKQPIVVGFLIDLSNSSRIHWKTYQEADPGAGLESAARRQALHGLPDFLRATRPISRSTPRGTPRRSPTRSAR